MLYYAQAEIEGVLQFIDEVYTAKFNFSYDLALSTRPEKFIGNQFFKIEKRTAPLPFARAPKNS